MITAEEARKLKGIDDESTYRIYHALIEIDKLILNQSYFLGSDELEYVYDYPGTVQGAERICDNLRSRGYDASYIVKEDTHGFSYHQITIKW